MKAMAHSNTKCLCVALQHEVKKCRFCRYYTRAALTKAQSKAHACVREIATIAQQGIAIECYTFVIICYQFQNVVGYNSVFGFKNVSSKGTLASLRKPGKAGASRSPQCRPGCDTLPRTIPTCQ